MMTEFDRKVYRAVLKIPLGETRTYKWVAEQVGAPEACRAVGNALNRNPFAPAVPCHRVIRSDGFVGGFAGGAERKKRLLAREKEIKACLETRK
jgi:O-6-methylguanine DNA methyltransferase